MHLTIIPIDKAIYLETPNATNDPTIFPNRRCHIVNDQEFWNLVDKDINAIQYHSDGQKEIEYMVSSGKGNVSITDISTLKMYIDKFNSIEEKYQALLTWQRDTFSGETLEEKITRIGPRPNYT